ncbi:MAG: SDR family NAD(P)-dependent oxidoreductase [Pseudomonadota bacterium]
MRGVVNALAAERLGPGVILRICWKADRLAGMAAKGDRGKGQMGGLCTIIGAGEGLGRALARKFALEGFDIAAVSRREAGSAAALAAVATARDGADARFFQADATRPETVEAALASVAETMGEIDVLIYNVRGDLTPCAPLEIGYEALEQTFRLEVMGALAAAKSVIPAMRRRGRGSLFFSSATAAYRGSATFPLYAIGKFGLRALSQSMAKAYGRDGVHVVHVRLDCDLDTPVMRALCGERFEADRMACPDAVAEVYWLTHLQSPGGWSNEIEIRPSTETWTF